MNIWYIIIPATLAITAGGVAYLTHAISRFALIQSISGNRAILSHLIALLLIAAGIFILSQTLSTVDAVVATLHLLAFFLLAGAAIRIVKHTFGWNPTIYWQGWIAIAATVITLSAGYYLCMNVWRTDYKMTTEKAVGNLKVAVFSDSHIGATFDGEGLAKHIAEIEAQSPDILLIPGDFVDDWSNKEDMVAAVKALGSMNLPYGVWMSMGNHDEGHFANRDFSGQELRDTLAENGIHLLEDTAELIDDRFYVIGREDAMVADRKTMDQLLEDLDQTKYMILMDHEPNAYAEEAGTVDLVVSGHTHGGQVIPIGWMGKITNQYDLAYGYEQREGTNFLVTSGISDWAMHFKTGTKSEYLMIEIDGQ